MPLSDADANNLLDTRFGGQTPNPPGTYYVGMSTTVPTTGGSNISEPSGDGYGRVAVTNNLTNWPEAANRDKSNGVELQWPQATGNWGTIVALPLFDAASGGTFRGFSLTAPQQVDTGGEPYVPIGALTISSPA